MADNKRKIQEVNAGSMADIAFLLLIFFLVATTMNVDSGIHRVLPPMPDEENQNPIDIKKRNLLAVYVSPDNRIMAGDTEMHITFLKDKAKSFILNTYNEDDLPEKLVKDIDNLGQYPISQGIISLQNDRGTNYNTYIMVQNELTRAFNEIRDEVSMRYFGRNFADLNQTQRDAVAEAVPVKISEAEPRNLGEI